MSEAHNLNLTNYTPVGDITVIALCIIMIILLHQTYVHKNKKFSTMIIILLSIVFSSCSNIIYEIFIHSENMPNHIFIYASRLAHHVMQTFVLHQYIKYLQEPLWIPAEVQKHYNQLTFSAVIIAAVADIAGTFGRFGFYINDESVVHYGFNVYIIIFAMFSIMTFYMIIHYRSRLIKQVFHGLLGVNIVSIIILMVQGMHNQVSFTSAAYFFPIIGIIFMFHSNPYDIEMGAVSGSFFSNEISESIDKKEELIIMCCTMTDFSKAIRQSKELRYEFYKFIRHNLRKGILYHFPNERLILTIKKKSSKNYEKIIENMLDDFRKGYENFNIDYKIIIMETTSGITGAGDYLKLIEDVENKMPFNEVHYIGEKDIKNFYSSSYILSQLEDIALKKDLNDERILVYCQPVFNISAGIYDTAEALMRLKLDKTGMVFPDQFIPIAEQHNMIHILSLIILNKTCRAIRDFLDEGYEIRRISVNFSVLDIRYDAFCAEVEHIIENNHIPYEKIAVEITESRSEADFNVMKQRVIQLQELGIKFYLDDFGTGYSNFERIMEIPFDIIKFDRSMLIESVKSDSSKFMVSTFANMFSQLNYAVLFEGVEDDRDEKHCVNMKANYLQGYKYSKPIPIGELKNFFRKTTVNQ